MNASPDVFCFHIMGGARKGGSTLTAAAAGLEDAQHEAKAHWNLGHGVWAYAFKTGPDAAGRTYHHFNWQPVGDP